MNVHDALDQLDRIHDQLARTEVYRGLRVPTVAVIGGIGILAAVLQPRWPEAASGVGFAYYWMSVAGFCGALVIAAGLRAHYVREDDFARRQTRRVLGQFLPCVLVGGAITAGIVRGGPEFIPFLPGLWAMTFGLGMIAVSPYLPTSVAAISFSYIVAGAALFLSTHAGAEPSGWAVGGVFGAGHFAMALALWHGEEKHDG